MYDYSKDFNSSDISFRPDDIYVWSDNSWDISTVPLSCRFCSNHPINGGSGVCWCVLGVPEIRC